MKKFIAVAIVLVMIVAICASSAKMIFAYDGNLQIEMYDGSSARGLCVLEGHTNTILYGKNLHKKMAMASTTKIITGILAIEHFEDLDTVITVDDSACGIEGTSIYLNYGEEISIRNLLYGLILASGNDSATALGIAVSGSEEAFVSHMNEFAARVGAINTSFDNAHGLDSKTHYTTPYDLALITSYAMKNDVFKEVVSTQTKHVPGTQKSGERYLRNKNKLTFTQNNNVGVKTGFTDDAGRCLVNAVEQDDMQIITVVLNCGPMFEEARNYTNTALKNYKMHTLITPYTYIGNIMVESGDKPNVNVVSVKGYKIPILKEELEKYRVEYDLPEILTAPVNLDEEIGRAKVYKNDDLIFETALYSIDEVKNVDFKTMVDNIIEHWF